MITESLQKLAEIEQPTNPFPGLRPFKFHESHLFFGRDGQSEQLIAKLSGTRFLAVVGTSGSGKSSLVRAGLLPALFGGFMTKAGFSWRVAIMRPGNDPIGNLARALNADDVFGVGDPENASVQLAIAEAILRRGNRGLIEAVRQADLLANENLLVLVDQFEELFRVEPGSQDNENKKAAFVKLLLEARNQQELPIYIVLTMRSDYLGDCAQFWDLPEAINQGQYLIPRMTREQHRVVITGPVAVGGAQITPRLVNRLLNDVGDNPDPLPILQHALMRAWDKWKETGQANEPIDLRHYEAIGGLSEALSLHADEAYNELPEGCQKLAEQIFKCLTEKSPDNREVRRPLTVRDICAVTEAEEPEVIAVIEAFRHPGRSFLMPPAEVTLTADSLIDISHESLICNWKRLKDWVEDEAQSARIYRRLAETATLHTKGEAGLWHDPDLQFALKWRECIEPNEAWARRYHPGFEAAMSFLEESLAAREAEAREKEEQRRRELKRTRIVAAILGLAFLISASLGLYGYQKRNEALDQERSNRRLFYVANMNLVQKAFAEKDLGRVNELLNALLPTVATDSQDDVRGFDWHYLWRHNHNEAATLRGHAGFVYSIAFAPNGKTLASGSTDGTVKLWEVSTGRELATLKGHAGVVRSVAFAPDGKTLASASADGMVKLWKVGTGRELATLKGHTGSVFSTAFAPDGKMLASGSGDGTVKLWEVGTGRELATLTGHAGFVYSVAFAPDGKTLASGSGDGTVKLWEVGTGRELATLTGHEGWVFSVTFAPDGKTLTSGSGDGTVKLWEVGMGRELATLKGHTGSVFSTAFAPDGKTLMSASNDGTMKLWEVGTGQELTTLTGHAGLVYSVAFAPDGKTLASGSSDGTVKLWEMGMRRTLATLTGHAGLVNSVAFAPDGKTLASGSFDGTVKLWEVGTGSELATLKGHTDWVYSVAFAPDGKTLASGSTDGTVKLWEVGMRRVLATLTGHAGLVYSVAFAPDGKTLASGNRDGTVKLWEVGTGRELATLKGHTDWVYSVAFAPDGKTLTSGSRDGTVKLWEVGTGRELATLKGHVDRVYSVAFAPDGKTLASGSTDGTVKLWEVGTGRELATLKGHAGLVYSVAFAPDGKTLASGSGDGTVKLWEVRIGQELATLMGRKYASYSVAFSPDGKTLASASDDGTVRLYFAATEEEIARQRSTSEGGINE